MPSVRKPGGSALSRRKLRSMSPAPMVSTSARATSSDHEHVHRPAAAHAGGVRTPIGASAPECISCGAPRSAGTSPKADSDDEREEYGLPTRPSTLTPPASISAAGSAPAAMRTRAYASDPERGTSHRARRSPSATDALRASGWPRGRHVTATLALAHHGARARSRFAKLAHAMRSTNPTAPSSTSSAGSTCRVWWLRAADARRSRTRSSEYDVGSLAQARGESVHCGRRAHRATFRASGARPAGGSRRHSPRASAGSSVNADHSFGGRHGKREIAGHHLTTVWATPFNAMDLPIRRGSAPNRRCQSPLESTATWSAPGRSSSREARVRPAPSDRAARTGWPWTSRR